MESNSSEEKMCSLEALETLGRLPILSTLETTGGLSPRSEEDDDETISQDEFEWYSRVALNGCAVIPRTIGAC